MQEFDRLYESYPRDGQIVLAECSALGEVPAIDILEDRIRKWSERNPDDTASRLIIAARLASSANGEVRDLSAALLRDILRLDPHCLKAKQVLAMLLQSTGHTAEAVQIYGQILEVEKDNLVVINNLAWILCEGERRYKQALELAAKGLEKSPDYVDLIDTCGVIYYRMGEHEKAARNFQKVIKMYPDNSPALVASRFHLARALAALGEGEGAIENLKISLNMHYKVGGLSLSEVAEADSLGSALMEGQNNVTVTK
jgi:tetratricopeptide (TPR) repeat protein